MRREGYDSQFDGHRSHLIVYLASCWWDGVAGTDRQLANAMASRNPVLYVQPPVSVLTRLRKPELKTVAEAPTIRVINPRLAVLSTIVVPGMSRPGVHPIATAMVRRGIRRAVARLAPGSGSVGALITSRVEDLWAAAPARRTLYYCLDDMAAGAELFGLPQARLKREEAATLRRADVVAAVSPELQARYVRDGYEVHLVPNGCDPESYSDVDRVPAPSDVDFSGPVAGFVGHINDRIDLSLLEAVAEAGCPLLLVGPVVAGFRSARFDALVGRANVTWVGPKRFDELPAYYRMIHVGLTPYADNAFNRASFPLKTLEYLAAGRGVVSTPLPATAWLGTDLIDVGDGPVAFVRAVRAALDRSHTDELMVRRRAFAREHSWAARAEAMTKLLGL